MSCLVDIAEQARSSSDFRRVLWTGDRSQVVVMTVPPGGEIGTEVHDDIDQVLVFVAGQGRCDLEDLQHDLRPGHLLVVPAGTRHDILSTGPDPLVLWTVYAPPEHADGVVHRTKEEADADEHDHH